jgi:hypothetical protein
MAGPHQWGVEEGSRQVARRSDGGDASYRHRLNREPAECALKV